MKKNKQKNKETKNKNKKTKKKKQNKKKQTNKKNYIYIHIYVPDFPGVSWSFPAANVS